jgi:hypothetical protein
MLVVFGATSQLDGSWAIAGLTAALSVGNTSSLVPRLISGAHAQAFVIDETTRVMQG